MIAVVLVLGTVPVAAQDWTDDPSLSLRVASDPATPLEPRLEIWRAFVPRATADVTAAEIVAVAAYLLDPELAADPARSETRIGVLASLRDSAVFLLESGRDVSLNRERYTYAAAALHAAHRWRGEAARAIDALEVGVEYLGTGDPNFTRLAWPLVDAWIEAGRWTEALELAESARAMLERASWDPSLRMALGGLVGKLRLRQGLPDQALELVYEAWEYESERYDAGEGWTQAYLLAAWAHLGDLMLASGDRAGLIERFSKVVDDDGPLFRGFEYQRGVLRIQLAVALLEDAPDDASRVARARELLDQALDEERLPLESRLSARNRQGLLAALSGDREGTARVVHAARLVTERLGSAAAVNERLLLEAIDVRRFLGVADEREELAAAETRLGAVFDELRHVWWNAESREGGYGVTLFLGDRFALGTLMRAREVLSGLPRAIETYLQLEAVGALARDLTGNEPSPDYDWVRHELLDERVGALVYLEGADGVDLYVLRGRGEARFTLGHPSSVEVESDSFVRAVLESPAGLSPSARESRARRLDENGRAVAGVLLPPEVRAELADLDTLLVVGSGQFRGVPFEALPVKGRTAGEEWGVVRLPSLVVGAALAAAWESATPGEVDLCLVTSPVPSASVMEAHAKVGLLAIDEEAIAAIAAPHGRSIVLRGDDATIAGLRDQAKRASIIQVVAHGVQDRARERPAGIVLTSGPRDDGVLWANAAQELSGPRLAVLAACGVDAGPVRAGDDAASTMAGALMRAGVPAAVLSEDDLALEAVLELTRVLQEQIAAGRSTALALRDARRALRASARWSDPYYFVNVYATGLAQRSVFAGPAPGARHDD